MRSHKLVIVFGALLVLTAGAFATLSVMMGGPRSAYGFLRYALPQMRKGDLRVGDPAPDFEALALDGAAHDRLHERIGPKPLVLIFGSYT